jgi:ABC-type transport system, involved in lipoprotein release, permease component
MWALAWRNVWRHRTRSLLAAGAVAAVVVFTILFFGFVTATLNGMFELLTTDLGHLQVISARGKDTQEFDARLIRDADAVEAALRRQLPDARLRRVLEVPALISGETRSRGALIIGLDQDDLLNQRFVEKHLAAGRLPARGSWDEIALGEALANALQVKLGDPSTFSRRARRAGAPPRTLSSDCWTFRRRPLRCRRLTCLWRELANWPLRAL